MQKTATPHPINPGGATEAFVKQVKDALEHLYDLTYLHQHPLQGPAGAGHPSGGQAQRHALADAIEALNPGGGVPFRAPQARPYTMVRLHYVQGMTVQEAARELGISERQAYRDLRQGERGVASVLWSRRGTAPPGERGHAARELSSMKEEMARLEPRPHPTHIWQLLRRAQTLVEPLARQRGVTLVLSAPAEPVVFPLDPIMARQVLVGLLSRAVQQAGPGDLHLCLRADATRATLTLRYDLDLDHLDAPVQTMVLAQLVDRLGWRLQHRDRAGGARAVTLHIAAHGPTVLVIDDNEGLVNLLSRYIADHACRVVAATGGQEGLRLAQAMVPDAIVLDVMMPEMDGWELLQRLRAHPQTREIPVIICSVINDPDLAQSLGASSFLPKPVTRKAILDVLGQLGVV